MSPRRYTCTSSENVLSLREHKRIAVQFETRPKSTCFKGNDCWTGSEMKPSFPDGALCDAAQLKQFIARISFVVYTSLYQPAPLERGPTYGW